ncbi:rab GTPase-activating protein eat-17 [Betta splendens]|uniref:Rab GTPase-activating protein eat-17 n=1 Tax=Betta splendens TaxID=158456 RepID=A0A6P7NS97_BETSP|nr:rab GTPase-activating protein eat-17 [Betta splendens]
MLSPSSPTQKNLGEEDSSGSDAESEISLEPETDRFGFILTNGSAAGNLGPPPELVRHRETKWINIIQQWDRVLLKKTNKVKVQCQKGIPASLRAKCWPLLCGATDRMKQNENLYQTLDSKPALQSWVDVIERDLDRQFPFHEMFLSKDGHGQRGLFRVLKAYTQYQPEEGYCQAQGPVAAVLLMNMPAEEAFWCLVQISEQYLPGYYSPLLEGVLFDAAMLSWVLKRTCPAAHKHLQHHGVEPLMFATDWLMCLFTRHLPFNTLLRVWDLFFCYGVRVLLQVAAVLVRRVLGRAEQRKQCQGQMETLEKLRGVREQIQEEDDSFIAEVCSVPLSAKDLEKQTAKELEKWRKDKPSSTFDPRGRCHGFQMAWARARQNKEDRQRKEREKGNLSVPIARSASTLSLSPSLLHKRWRKGSKASTGECEGGGRVRHLSMGAKEDFNSWTELNFEKVQDLQEEEDVVSDEHNTQRETHLTGQTDLIQNIPTVHIEEATGANEQIEKVETGIIEEEGSKGISKHTEETNVAAEPNQGPVETRIIEEEESKLISEHTKETNVATEPNQGPVETRIIEEEESKLISEHTEETNVAAEPNQGPVSNEPGDNIPSPLSEHMSQHHQEEEMGSCSQSQVEKQQDHQGKNQDSEVPDVNVQIEKQVVEDTEHMSDVEENQSETHRDATANTNKETPHANLHVSVESTEEQVIQSEIKPCEGLETDNVQQTQAETAANDKPDSSPGSEKESHSKEIDVKDLDLTTEKQHQQEEVLIETDTVSTGDVFKAKGCSSESLAEIGMEERYAQTETETVPTQAQDRADDNASSQEELEAEVVQTEAESRTEAETLTLEGVPLDEHTDTETQAACVEARKASTQHSETEGDAVTCELTQGQEQIILTVHTEEKTDGDHTESEETPCKTQTETVETGSVSPQQKEEAGNITTEAEQEPSEEPAPAQPVSQVSEANTEEEDILISPPNVTDSPRSDNIPQVQDKESSPTEANDPTQTAGRRSSRSSGDFCVRRSSNSHGSRLARRLSEDLFTSPLKTSQAPSSCSQEPQHAESDAGAVNPALPEVSQAPDVRPPPTVLSTKEETAAQQEPQTPSKRFGLFRRLRGEPKKANEKGKQKMQVPKILIQDFSDGTGKPAVQVEEEKLNSRERRRRRRVEERREKEEERLKKKKEKELEKEKERERRKPQTRGKSFQVQKEKGGDDTGSKTFRHSTSYAESYF